MSRGEEVADFRFLLLEFGSRCISFALSNAFHARISSVDSGSLGSGRWREFGRSRRVEAVSRNLFVPPCLSAT